MSTAPIESLPAAERRRLVAFGLLRASATTVLVVAAYYLLPLDNLAGVSLGVALVAGLLALTAVVAYQVRAIIRHRHSAVRAVEALAITVPVFLLLFAAAHHDEIREWLCRRLCARCPGIRGRRCDGVRSRSGSR